MKKLAYKIVFFGTPDFVSPVLSALEKNFNVVKVFRKPLEFNDKTLSDLKRLNIDFFVVASFGQILPEKLLKIPKIAAINIHPSLLPLYRGPSPIQTAILNGDQKTGVTFIKMDEKMDHGALIDQFTSKIKPEDTFESLAKDLFEKAAEKLPSIITHYNDAELKIQNESKVSYTKLLNKQDGFIDLETLEIGNLKLDIERAVRAFFPWPGVWTKFDLSNKEVIIKFLPDRKLQVEGKNPMSYKDFINGYKNGKQLLDKLSLI